MNHQHAYITADHTHRGVFQPPPDYYACIGGAQGLHIACRGKVPNRLQRWMLQRFLCITVKMPKDGQP